MFNQSQCLIPEILRWYHTGGFIGFEKNGAQSLLDTRAFILVSHKMVKGGRKKFETGKTSWSFFVFHFTYGRFVKTRCSAFSEVLKSESIII